jgi:hypothetical protein
MKPEDLKITPWYYDDFYLPSSRIKSLETFPLYSFPRAWVNLTDKKVKVIRDNVLFNLSLTTSFFNKLSLKVDCTRAYCPSCNALLQNRILPLTPTSRPARRSRLPARIFFLGSTLEELPSIDRPWKKIFSLAARPPESCFLTEPRPDGRFQSQVCFLVSTLEENNWSHSPVSWSATQPRPDERFPSQSSSWGRPWQWPPPTPPPRTCTPGTSTSRS